MWTDDAAQSFSDEIDVGEDFLYIDDEGLAMHWLSTCRIEVAPEGDRAITGHWRAPEVPEGWEKMASGTAPFLNGGGEWKVYRAIG